MNEPALPYRSQPGEGLRYFTEMIGEQLPENAGSEIWYTDVPLISRIMPHLYVGNLCAAESLDIILLHEIYHVLTFRKDPSPSPPFYRVADIVHYTFLLFDGKTPKIDQKEKLTNLIFPWLTQARKRHQGIFIHCLGCVSRSPGFMITALMKLEGMSFLQARELVIRRHSPTAPNPSVMQFFLECLGHTLPKDYPRWYRTRLEEVVRAAKFLKQ